MCKYADVQICFLLKDKNLHIRTSSHLHINYSSSIFILLRSIPKPKPLSFNTCSISLKDFFPKFLNFIRSSCSYLTSSLNELIFAAFKQLKALTERSRSSKGVFKVFLN